MRNFLLIVAILLVVFTAIEWLVIEIRWWLAPPVVHLINRGVERRVWLIRLWKQFRSWRYWRYEDARRARVRADAEAKGEHPRY
ncbi:hypothetical protein A3A67_05035 [Candidatus Peribacteria bacterium RIFCSPLOWO2_01_FULL_51_18]|nr:MAG: hypothetical protein A3C52_02115 [Candidatus Peribacteria bacterium RIFCSPHIGHO2_02_FULL_51_15]OGJ66144.1 MAG: hypothetical protein A3A67_05035 [Candidatus Peribacteria bacterium RIFCSPLOWO2_01_FULL_51_18]OGJ68636.1 MAG: hypothetical protein A3J34_00205 [Candidatus Peribacteria bacterium RIFCSPLOWO2_02_FULL_51_10]